VLLVFINVEHVATIMIYDLSSKIELRNKGFLTEAVQVQNYFNQKQNVYRENIQYYPHSDELSKI
jgi:hypothetical protein